jgi:hypothetical protein
LLDKQDQVSSILIPRTTPAWRKCESEVDAHGSGPCGRNPVRVRFSRLAPKFDLRSWRNNNGIRGSLRDYCPVRAPEGSNPSDRTNVICSIGEAGIRGTLKACCPSGRAGSSPVSSTTLGWRSRYTRHIQIVLSFGTCGFESRHPYKKCQYPAERGKRIPTP